MVISVCESLTKSLILCNSEGHTSGERLSSCWVKRSTCSAKAMSVARSLFIIHPGCVCRWVDQLTKIVSRASSRTYNTNAI